MLWFNAGFSGGHGRCCISLEKLIVAWKNIALILCVHVRLLVPRAQPMNLVAPPVMSCHIDHGRRPSTICCSNSSSGALNSNCTLGQRTASSVAVVVECHLGSLLREVHVLRRKMRHFSRGILRHAWRGCCASKSSSWEWPLSPRPLACVELAGG